MSNDTLISPEDMTPDQLALALHNVKIIEGWIKAVREHAFDVLKAGGQVPGYKLGYGVRKRIWNEEKKDEAIAMLKELGVPHDEMYTSPELITLPQMEKVIKSMGKWPKHKRTEEKPAGPLDDYTSYSMPEPRVVPYTATEDDAAARIEEAKNEFA